MSNCKNKSSEQVCTSSSCVNINWKDTYSYMSMTAEEAIASLKPGDRVFIGTGCAQPSELLKALSEKSQKLPDTEIVHMLTFGETPHTRHEVSQYLRINSFLVGDNIKGAICKEQGSYTPISLSSIPHLFSSGEFPLDVALIQVSPPNERGECSLGISVDIVKSAAENASLVIAEVNSQMPRTLGDSKISIWDIDIIVPVDKPLTEVQTVPDKEEYQKIGELTSTLVEDGSTIEFGIGEIPQAIIKCFRNKKDLGIHTEMLSDAVIDIIESGAVTGNKKSLDRSKVVASFCIGTKRLYDYINNNPKFSFRPTEYVNNPSVISQQNSQVAINSAYEVDLSGQIGGDSLSASFASGIGGQIDFASGAAKSINGKVITTLTSTKNNGELSSIVPNLSPKTGLTISRADAHYIVTEYGIACLHGKSIQERAIALISIAHPKFRADLLKSAIEMNYVRPEFAIIESQLVLDSPQYKASYTLQDGTQLLFRSVLPTDTPLVRDMFYALSQETIHYRFTQNLKQLPKKQFQDFVFVNTRGDVAIVATIPEAHGEEIIGIGRYYLDQKTNHAEVAFVVRDDWQNKKVGSLLLKHLISVAKRNGIKGFTAEVLRSNIAMQAVFNKSETKVSNYPKDDVYSFELEF